MENEEENHWSEGDHPPKGPGGPPKREPKLGERVALSLRMTPDLKRRLDAAAEKGGRSQSQEAEIRLQQSFDRQDLLSEVLALAYGRELAGLLMMLGEGMTTVGNSHYFQMRRARRLVHWTDDAETFNQAVLAATSLLNAARPRGRVTEPPIGRQVALEMINALDGGSVWRNRPNRFALLAKTIRSLLGPITDRMVKAHLIGRIGRTEKSEQLNKDALVQARQFAISAAVDAVLRLINTAPRTPSREELTQAIEKQLLPQSKDATAEKPKR